MNKNIFVTFLFTLFFFVAFGQDPIYLKRNAVKVERQDSLNDDIYKLISGYQVIMVGEAHGANEPARFVTSMTDLFTRKGNFVQIGLEIPSEKMKKYISFPIYSNIYSSDFFSLKSYDHRASHAWAGIIAKFNDSHNVEIFFFDANAGDSKNYNDRDSLMYLKIKKRIQMHPSWITITLSGNIHNMLTPYDDKAKMALYLLNDKDLNISSKILSIDHIYASGKVWDNEDNGAKFYQADNSDSFFAKSVEYENYLFLYQQGSKMSYNGIYFTRKITAAKMVSEK